MAILDALSVHPMVQEPDVWISRLVVFESIADPEPKIIRDVPFSRGLNIIWAREDDGESPDEGIGGHSAGKTTLCRFIRYVLGESTFGTRQNTKLLHQAFPDGYIAAELHIAGIRWAVRRPFGKKGRTYVLRDATIEDLLQQRGEMVSQEEYSAKIGLEQLCDKLESKTVVRTNEEIKWGHILAWCTRDQEARFQSLQDWRSSRSGHESPTFKFSTAGPLFVIRAVLGLINQDEIALEGRIAAMQRRQALLEKNVEEKLREPQYLIKSNTERLLQYLRPAFPGEKDLETRPFQWPKDNTLHFDQDLETLANQGIHELLGTSTQLDDQVAELQHQIDELGDEYGRLTYLKKRKEDSLAMDHSSIGDIENEQNDIEDAREIQARIEEFAKGSCDFAGIPYDECEYIKARMETSIPDGDVNEQAIEDERFRICTRMSRIKTEVEDFQRQITENRRRQKELQGERNDSQHNAQAFREQAHNLKWVVAELSKWIAFSDNPEDNHELRNLHSTLAEVKAEYPILVNDLRNLSYQHKTKRQLLSRLFSAIVRAVLRSEKYKGVISLNNDGELQFGIANGPAMSGEAIETLAVLLADIASVFYSATCEKASHPRFLLHDSPHEADLAGSIYRSFIRVMAEFHEELGGEKSAPFQYILTTTSAPPNELQNSERIKLHLSAPDDMLLRCDIREAALEAAEAPALF